MATLKARQPNADIRMLLTRAAEPRGEQSAPGFDDRRGMAFWECGRFVDELRLQQAGLGRCDCGGCHKHSCEQSESESLFEKIVQRYSGAGFQPVTLGHLAPVSNSRAGSPQHRQDACPTFQTGS